MNIFGEEFFRPEEKQVQKALRQKHTCWVPGMTGPPGIRGQNGKWEWRTQKGLEHNNRRWVSMYNQN